MLFGQSIFQSVLTRLKDEQADETAEVPEESFRIRGLNTGFVASTTDQAEAMGTGTEAYFAFMDDDLDAKAAQTDRDQPKPEPAIEPETRAHPEPAALPEQPAEPEIIPAPSQQPVPAHLLRLTQEEIAQELAIGVKDTEQSLADKRRRFAKHNHPDRVAPTYRDNAHIRMQTANLLIDQALKRLAWR
jgi:hypothetical protein